MIAFTGSVDVGDYAACVAAGWETATYLDPGHPLQVMNRANVARYKPDVCLFDAGKATTCEHPGGLRIGPGDRFAPVRTDDVAQHPLIGGRPHRQGADLLDEGRIPRLVDITKGKEPVERIVESRDESIEA